MIEPPMRGVILLAAAPARKTRLEVGGSAAMDFMIMKRAITKANATATERGWLSRSTPELDASLKPSCVWVDTDLLRLGQPRSVSLQTVAGFFIRLLRKSCYSHA